MSRRPRPLFLARPTYRRRRIMDAARLVPVAGVFLVLLPVLWLGGPADAPARTARVGVYLFAVWALLIVAAAIIAAALGGPEDEDGPAPTAAPSAGQSAAPTAAPTADQPADQPAGSGGPAR